MAIVWMGKCSCQYPPLLVIAFALLICDKIHFTGNYYIPSEQAR